MNGSNLSKLQRTLALAALAISAYELYIRISASIIPLKMFFNMWIGEGISLEKGLKYVDVSIFYLPIFLIFTILFALYCLFSKRRIKRSFLLSIFSCPLMFFAVKLENGIFTRLWQTITLIPLSLIFSISVLQIFLHLAIKKT